MNVPRMLVLTLCAANAVAAVLLWSSWTFASVPLPEFGRANPLSWGDRPTLVIAADPQTVDVASFVTDARREGHVTNLTIAVVVPDDAAVSGEDFGADRVLRAAKLPSGSRGLVDVWNTWVLFDGSGEVLDQGPLRGTRLAGVLQTRIAGEPDLGARAALTMQEAFQEGLLEPPVPFGADSRAILLLSTVGAACGTGEALRKVRAMMNRHQAIPISVMVPASWNAQEIAALRNAFQLPETPVRVHPALERVWKELEDTFGENRTAGMLLLIDKRGLRTVFTDRLGILDGLKGLAE